MNSFKKFIHTNFSRKNLLCFPLFSMSRTKLFFFLLQTLLLILILFTISTKFHPLTIQTLTSWLQYSSSAAAVFDSCISKIPRSCPQEFENKTENGGTQDSDSCDIFDGKWVFEKNPLLYKPGSCSYIDESFNCFKNGRPDLDYLMLKWKPINCEIPRFDGLKMLNMIKGKRLVFVGDSLNRNMWESLVCALKQSLGNNSRVLNVSGRQEFKTQGFYSFYFKGFNCSIDYIRSPFLVQEWKFSDKDGTCKETLRLDMMQQDSYKYLDADIVIFNTGHWWTHEKIKKGNSYFQEGNQVYKRIEIADAYTKALRTWAEWVDSNINSTKTRVFFNGYTASHFKGGQWNSGGSCDGETQPITNDTYLSPYPKMMRILESIISEMKTPVFYLNITKMTDYRKDGHPSIFREPWAKRRPGMMVQDCSHWCLPGVPDSWNEILFAILISSYETFSFRFK